MIILKYSIINRLFNIGRIIKRSSFQLINVIKRISLHNKQIRNIKNKINNNEKINVLFILQYPEMWNSEKSVYMAFCSDTNYDTKILTVPKQIGVAHSNGNFSRINEASIYCDKNDLLYINSRIDERWIDISQYDFDIIFIQRPYDECMPKQWSLKNLSKYSLLCYIPYGFDFTKDIHLRIEYNAKFLDYVSYYFADNSETFYYVQNRSKINTFFKTRESFNLGYPRFDFIKTIDHVSLRRKSVLWIPRWSTQSKNDRSFFFDYLEVLLSFFDRHTEMKLIIRPHPLMFNNFVEKKIMTESEVFDLKNRINKIQNVSWDKNFDYLETFDEVDLMISDFSSLMIEFYATLKPLIYCGGNLKTFNNIGRTMAKGLYHVNNSDELIRTLEMLQYGDDIYYNFNKEIVDKYIKDKNDIGIEIKKALYETLIK